MKFSDVIRLSFLNIRCNIKMALSIIIGLIVMLLVILTSVAYGFTMNNHISDIIKNNSSLTYNSTSMMKTLSEAEIQKFKNDSRVEGIKLLYIYQYGEYCEDVSNGSYQFNKYSPSVDLDQAVVSFDNNEYQGINDYSFDFNVEDAKFASRTQMSVNLNINVMNIDNIQFSSGELQEFQNKFHSSEIFVAGGKMTKNNQIMLSEYILSKFGITYPPEQCIGKKLTVLLKTENGNIPVLKDYEICGIIKTDFFRINSRKSTSHIIVSSADMKYCHLLSREIYSKNFRDAISFYNDNSSTGSINMSDALKEFSEIEAQQLLFNEVVIVIGFVLIAAVVLFVYFVIYFYFKKRNRYVCIQKAIGLYNFKIYVMIFFELIMLGICSIIIAVPLYIVLTEILNGIFINAVASSFFITPYASVIAIIASFVFLVVFTLIISAVEFLKTTDYSVVNREKII